MQRAATEMDVLAKPPHTNTLEAVEAGGNSATLENNDFGDLTSIIKSYNGIVGDVLDVPEEDTWSPALTEFINHHRSEYKNMNAEVNALKLKVKRLITL